MNNPKITLKEANKILGIELNPPEILKALNIPFYDWENQYLLEKTHIRYNQGTLAACQEENELSGGNWELCVFPGFSLINQFAFFQENKQITFSNSELFDQEWASLWPGKGIYLLNLAPHHYAGDTYSEQEEEISQQGRGYARAHEAVVLFVAITKIILGKINFFKGHNMDFHHLGISQTREGDYISVSVSNEGIVTTDKTNPNEIKIRNGVVMQRKFDF